MRKTTLLVAGFLVTLLSCSRTEQDGRLSGYPGSQDRTAVQLGMDMKSIAQSKSTGPVDVWNGQQKIFIYAFPYAASGEPDWAQPFIDNVGALSPASGTSGSLDLQNPASTGGEPFYYEKGKVYDFYGYYVDDAAHTWNTDGSPAVSFTQDLGWGVLLDLNGQQDVMSAKANRELAAAGSGIALESVFSEHAARKGVHPDLVFEHALSRFRFRLLSGSESAHNNVTVDAISMESDTKAALVVAGPGAGTFTSGEKGWLSLPMAAPVHLPAADGTAQPLEGSMMVTPNCALYKLRLHLDQSGVSDTPASTMDLTVDMSSLVGLEEPLSVAGHAYWVNITVYGISEVALSVTLADWDVAGEIEIDPDADFYIHAQAPAPVPAIGGDLAITLSKAADTQFTYTLDSDWVHIDLTKAASGQQETLYFTVDPNEGVTRVAKIHFYVGGLPDSSVQIIQHGAADVLSQYGIYPTGGESFVFNPATQLISVYADGAQRWSRILLPATTTVHEIGPIPASLSQGQQFSTTYKVLTAGHVVSSQNLTLRVTAVNGRDIQLLDTSSLSSFFLIY